MSYGDLHRLGVTVRPIHDFGPENEFRRYSPFRAPFRDTIAKLSQELRALGAERIVLGLGLTEGQIRTDGLPRADARTNDPRVQLAFVSIDHYGAPMQFNVDAFNDWRDNLRALALGLESLRRVDRYGITRNGEQYRGWKQLPSSTDSADAIVTRAQAEELLAHYGGFTAAVKATHPDAGGDETEFRKVMRAKEILA